MQKLSLILCLLLMAAAPAAGLEQHLGAFVPTDLALRDDDGRLLAVSQAIGSRPSILALVYYRCPNLCGLVLADLTRALGGVHKDYSLLVASIDPQEGPADGADTRRRYGGAGRGNWHFLSGDAAPLEHAVGYKARRDPKTGQLVHPAALVIVSPRGRITSYLLGLGYRSADIDTALQAAQSDHPQASPSPILLLCFHYDPATGRYSLAITRILSGMAALTVAGLGLYIALARGRR